MSTDKWRKKNITENYNNNYRQNATFASDKLQNSLWNKQMKIKAIFERNNKNTIYSNSQSRKQILQNLVDKKDKFNTKFDSFKWYRQSASRYITKSTNIIWQ